MDITHYEDKLFFVAVFIVTAMIVIAFMLAQDIDKNKALIKELEAHNDSLNVKVERCIRINAYIYANTVWLKSQQDSIKAVTQELTAGRARTQSRGRD